MNGISVAIFSLFKCNCRLGGGAKKNTTIVNTAENNNLLFLGKKHKTSSHKAAFKSLVTHFNKDMTIGPLLHSSQNTSKKSCNIAVYMSIIKVNSFMNGCCNNYKHLPDFNPSMSSDITRCSCKSFTCSSSSFPMCPLSPSSSASISSILGLDVDNVVRWQISSLEYYETYTLY